MIRSTRSNAKAPSSLAGLLVDPDGKAFSPRHSNRKGKRYRYYVAGNISLPGHEIERVVVEELTSLLSSPSRLMTLLPPSDPAFTENCIARASAMALELRSGPSPEIITKLVRQIAIDQNQMQIEIADMKQALTSEAADPCDAESDQEGHAIIREIKIKRSSHGKRLVLGGDGSNAGTRSKADTSWLQAIARAHMWLGSMKKGSSYKEIADAEDIDARIVARTIRLAFLAPDITEAILKGKEPRDLSADGLLRLPNLPTGWQEQRDLLGFS